MCLILLFPLLSEIKAFAEEEPYYSKNSNDEILSIANGIIAWKKSDNGSSENGYLINEKFLELAGTTPETGIRLGLADLELPIITKDISRLSKIKSKNVTELRAN